MAGSDSVDVIEQGPTRLEREVRRRLDCESRLAEAERSLESTRRALEKIARSLDEQRRQLDTTLNHVLVGTFLINRRGQIVRANAAAMRMFGLDDESIFETRIGDLFGGEAPPPDEGLRAPGAVEPARTGCPLREAVVHRSDGTQFEAEYGCSPAMGADGRPQTVWIFRDVTQRKAREERALALEQELAAARKFEALGTLAGGVAHEINTPMQYLGDNLQFLDKGIHTLGELVALARSESVSKAFAEACETRRVDFLLKEIPGALEESRKGVEAVVRIVRAIHAFSHPGTGKPEIVDVADTVRDAVAMTCHQWKSKARVDVDLPDEPLRVKACRGDLDQVLVNMIVNALQALSDDGGRRSRGNRIDIAVRPAADEIRLTVRDNGPGIPNDIRERIFDPFFTTKGVGIGSGQGLAIARRIVCDRIGGAVALLDEGEEGGACFEMRLPMAGSEQPEPATATDGGNDERG